MTVSPVPAERSPITEGDLKSFYQGHDVLVTGANGFLGAHLVRRLADLGARCTGLHRPTSNLLRLAEFSSRIALHAVDLRDAEGLRNRVRAHPPKVVFHVAAQGVDPGKRDLETMFQSNVLGLVNLLEALEGVPLDAFVNTGTCSEYGPRGDGPRPESEAPDPVSAYGVSKAAAVMLGVVLARTRRRPIVTLRPFTTFGPYERSDRLVGYVTTCVIKGEEIRMTGGVQARDFIYIDDVVEAYLRAGIPPVASGEIINVGSGQVVTIKALVEKVREIAGSTVPVRVGALPYRDDEIWHLCADIRRARERLAWSPQVSLDEGLRRTLDWYRRSLALAESLR